MKDFAAVEVWEVSRWEDGIVGDAARHPRRAGQGGVARGPDAGIRNVCGLRESPVEYQAGGLRGVGEEEAPPAGACGAGASRGGAQVIAPPVRETAMEGVGGLKFMGRGGVGVEVAEG